MDPPSNLPIDYLNLLPDEMLLKILIKTDDLDTLSKWCQSSKRINRICQDKTLWKQKYQKDFGFSSRGFGPRGGRGLNGSRGLSGNAILVEGETWKEKYKQRATFKVRNSPISIGSSLYGIIDENGRLYWGKISTFSYRVKGTSSRRGYTIPKVVPFKSKVISVSCATDYMGAVTEDGTAYLWGNLYYFDADLKSSNTPVKLKLPSKALKITCGYNDMGGSPSTIFAVILDDLSVYFRGKFTDWGMNLSGRLNLEAKDIYTGQDFVAMITLDNQLYYFGHLPYDPNSRDNPYDNYDNYDIVQDYRPYLFSFPEPIKQMAFGESHQIILSTKGEVYTMGTNDEGQLGRPVLVDHTPYDFFGPFKLDLPVPIVSISAGVYSAAAISETGRLFVWGKNTIIDHKNPDYENAILPTEVDIGSPVNYVSISDYSFLAVTQDGAVNFSVRS